MHQLRCGRLSYNLDSLSFHDIKRNKLVTAIKQEILKINNI